MRTAAILILATCLLLLAATLAKADTCASELSAKHVNSQSHLAYSKRIAGHKGEKCWFAGISRHTLAKASTVPLPRERIVPIQHSRIEEAWEALREISPQARLEASFEAVGWK